MRKVVILGVVLLGLFLFVFGFYPPHFYPVKQNKTESLIATLETGLSKYQIDFGEYPEFIGPSYFGGTYLYRVLTDYDRSYVRQSSIDANSKDFDFGRSFVDAWGGPIHYQAQVPNVSDQHRKTMNPTYDLWSTGGSPDNEERDWITNWK